MVRQRASRARLWLKLLALVAANAVLLTQAVDSAATAGPVVQAVKKDVCFATVSPGDGSVGIAVVTDVACKSGGLGCFQDVCRFYKARSTSQSQHLLGCEKISGSTVSPQATPTPALSLSGSAPQCTSKVSPGDAGVGVDLVADLTCCQGGLGCFQDVCRFCKRRDTPQSRHSLRCDQIAPTPVATASPRPTAKPTPTPASKPIATTPKPAPTPAPTPTSAPKPIATTSISSPALAIPDRCASAVPSQASALGLVTFMDPTYRGSISPDCTNIVCRICKTTSDPRFDSFKFCDTFPNAPASIVPAPTPTPTPTPAPTPATGGFDSTPATPVPSPIPVPPDSYSAAMSAEVLVLGFAAFTNPTCKGSGSFDCTNIVCRVCKTADDIPGPLKLCSSFPNAPASFINAPISPTTPSPEPATAVPGRCSSVLPADLTEIGAVAFVDPTCRGSSAFNCTEIVCRACKTSSHPAFLTLRFCLSFSPPATPAPEPTSTASPAPSTPADCSLILPEGSANFGFYTFLDPTCKEVTSQDCSGGVCRLCKTIERDELTVLKFCDSFPNASKPAPVDTETPAPASTAWEPDAPTEVPRTCSSSVPPEAAALGLETDQPELTFYRLCSSFDDSSPAAPSSSMKYDDLRITSAAIAMGITVFQDSSCSPTSPDCLMGMCRLCKNNDRMGLEAYQFCNTFPDAPVVDPMAETCPYIQPPDVTSQIGIVVFTDLSCKDESSFDYFQLVYRVCKVKSMLRSRSFKWCSQLPTPPPMDVEITSNLAPDPSYCTMYLDNSAVSQGIWAGSQSTGCGMGGGECNEYQCNQCKYLNIEQALSLPPCSGMIFTALPTNPDDTVAASRPAGGPSYCSDVLDNGSVSSGIRAVFDRECDTRGCNNFSYRFCKLFETTASSGLVPCDQLMYIPPPLSVAQPPSEMEVPASATEIPTPIEDQFPISATGTPTPSEGEFPSIATEAPSVFDDDITVDHLPPITVDGTVVTGPFFSLDGVMMLHTPIGPVVIIGSEITTEEAEVTMSVLVDTPNGPQSIQFPVSVDKLSLWASLNSTLQPPEGDLGGESTIEPISEPNQDTSLKTDEDDPQSTTTVVIQTPTGSVTVEIPVAVNDGTSAMDATSTDVTDSGLPAVDDGTTCGGQSVIDWAALLGTASVTDVVPGPLASGTGEATSM